MNDKNINLHNFSHRVLGGDVYVSHLILKLII